WPDNIHLPLRKILDPDKAGFLHFIANPQGPHAENIPLYDLVLLRKPTRDTLAATPGLYLVEPHAELIWKGKKTAIVKCRNFDMAGKTYILVSRRGGRGRAYGKIEVHEPVVITLKEFEESRDEHRISDEEREEWWPDYDKLYLYRTKYFTPYEKPRPVDIPQGVQTFVRNVKLAAEPIRIDIGCGHNKPAGGYVGVDNRPLPGVDVLHNLDLGLPFPDDYADEIRAYHILEHLRDPVWTMWEIWRVLKPNGRLVFEVPSTSGEGAFAHPDHKSYWNKTSFLFYCNNDLLTETRFPGKFAIENIEERTSDDGRYIYVSGVLRAVKPAAATQLAVSPWYSGPLPKPAMKLYTEFFSINELWDKWAAKRIERGLAVEEKLNGFRALCQKKGDQVKIKFEGPGEQVHERLPELAAALRKASGDFILDCSIGIEEQGTPWPRVKLMTLLASKPQVPAGSRVIATAFDVLHDGEDVTDLPQRDRRKRLETLVKRIGSPLIRVSRHETVTTRSELEKAAKELAGRPMSEGIVVKTQDAPYPLKSATSKWAKVKHKVDIQALVLETRRNKAGTYNFRGGLLLGKADFPNTVKHKGQTYVDLGFSFNAPFSAAVGKIVAFEVEEIILQTNGDLAWLGAKPTSVEARKTPYHANQVVDLAHRGHILQDARNKSRNQQAHSYTKCMVTGCDTPPTTWILWAEGKAQAWFCKKHFEEWKKENPGEICTEKVVPDGDVKPILDERKRRRSKQAIIQSTPPAKAPGEEGETRATRSATFWKEHWHESFPPSGKDKFVYQHHWRGLSEEEAKQNEAALLRTNHSVHGDLRLSFGPTLFGWTVFTGKTSDLRDGRDLDTLPSNDALQVSPKLHQPTAWLTIARKVPFVADPGEAGSTSQKYSKFFEIDHGAYQIGVWREHSFELFLHGEKLKGRYIVSYAPVAEGRQRVWLIRRPKDQTPYAETHDRDEIVEELKRKGQRWLIWAKPGQKPEKTDVNQVDIKKQS
nr:methyltransferase domain-containing protein [Chloroflexota bacterium]